MAALAADRDTLERDGRIRHIPVAASTKIYAGSIVVVNASGYAVPMTAATARKVVGRAEESADNSAGAAGAINVMVARGVFRWGNSTSTDQIGRADIGSTCYGVDDQTVAKTDGSSARSPAGTVFDVDAGGVWVEI